MTTAELNEIRGRRWSTSDARRVLACWRASGLSMRAFGARHGLAAERLGWWKKRLDEWRESASEAAGAPLVPAVVRVPAADAPVSIRLPSGVSVEVADTNVEPAWLVAVVSGLSRPA